MDGVGGFRWRWVSGGWCGEKGKGERKAPGELDPHSCASATTSTTGTPDATPSLIQPPQLDRSLQMLLLLREIQANLGTWILLAGSLAWWWCSWDGGREGWMEREAFGGGWKCKWRTIDVLCFVCRWGGVRLSFNQLLIFLSLALSFSAFGE